MMGFHNFKIRKNKNKKKLTISPNIKYHVYSLHKRNIFIEFYGIIRSIKLTNTSYTIKQSHALITKINFGVIYNDPYIGIIRLWLNKPPCFRTCLFN